METSSRRKVVLLISAVCFALGYARILDIRQKYPQDWEQWKQKFGKKYESLSEEQNRLQIWQENLAKVLEHNALYENGEKSFKMGMNVFADLTSEEFRQERMGPRMPVNMQRYDWMTEDKNVGAIVPDSQDWREKGYVTPVADQGHNCASSWAWSCTGAMEGLNFNKTGTLINLSEQQLLDCTRNNTGCASGSTKYGFDYLIKYGGSETEKCYTYKNGRLALCSDTQCNVVANITGYRITPFADEITLKEKVGLIGPVSVTVDAGYPSTAFQLYESGIYYDPACTQVLLGQSLLIVGYGNSTNTTNVEFDNTNVNTPYMGNSTGAYWIVKNSWGIEWGMDGYMWMSRGRNNNCGIASLAMYPIA